MLSSLMKLCRPEVQKWSARDMFLPSARLRDHRETHVPRNKDSGHIRKTNTVEVAESVQHFVRALAAMSTVHR